VVNNLECRYHETSSEYIKGEIEKYMREIPCEACHGKRLKKEALAVTVGGKNIADLSEMSIVKIYEFLNGIEFSPSNAVIAKPIAI
jgi:excinuclease ABC subunit A